MKPTVTILVCALATGLASAQSPRVIQNTRNTMNAVSNHATAASNQALGIHKGVPPAETATQTARKSVAAPAVPHTADAKRREHWRRGGALLVGQNAEPASTAAPQAGAPAGAAAATPGSEGENAANEQPIVPDTKYAANGRRDPFISPVVSQAGGSGCSSGKKCLEIGAINLRGVVRAESGFIAVVSNGLNKAYFLRENDPVFNGYVMKITGDSVVFQETLQDRMGKTFTREVVKKVTAPAV